MVTSVSSSSSSGSENSKSSRVETSSSWGYGDPGESIKLPGMGLRGDGGNGVSVATVEDDASEDARWAVDSCN